MNRSISLKRLFLSLKNAIYDNDKINIEIFIDASPQNNRTCQDTIKIVKDFNWLHGEKHIFENEKNLGHIKQWLRRPLSEKPFFIFEDDLQLSPDFYLIIKNIISKKPAANLYQSLLGVSLGNIRYVIKNDNCRHFHPQPCIKKNNITENHSYFMNQFEPWGPFVFSDKWNETVEYFEQNENLETKVIHCIPNALSNKWYNASDTFIQYFMFKKAYLFMFLNIKTEIVHNFREKGLHFDGSNLLLKHDVFRLKNNNLTITYDYIFDIGFNRIYSRKLDLPKDEINDLTFSEKCKIRY